VERRPRADGRSARQQNAAAGFAGRGPVQAPRYDASPFDCWSTLKPAVARPENCRVMSISRARSSSIVPTVNGEAAAWAPADEG